jgi:hypothetical protein
MKGGKREERKEERDRSLFFLLQTNRDRQKGKNRERGKRIFHSVQFGDLKAHEIYITKTRGNNAMQKKETREYECVCVVC